MSDISSQPLIGSIELETSLRKELLDACGQALALEREHWRRERELVEAQIDARLARFDARSVEAMAQLETRIAERLAQLHDGKDGQDGKQGETGPQGPAGEQGPSGKDGANGEPGIAGDAGTRGDVGPAGPPGAAGALGPQGQLGEPGPRGFEGPVGPEGAPGKLPIVKTWTDEIHYVGAVVAHGGATWQAHRDTGKEPGTCADWTPLARAGKDGVTPRVRELWSENEQYRALDIVALNGGSFIARKDNPGVCPGDGWQLLASQGRSGPQGGKGAAGEPGAPGAPGAKGETGRGVVGWRIDGKTYRVFARMSDGHETALELRPLFEQFHSENQ